MWHPTDRAGYSIINPRASRQKLQQELAHTDAANWKKVMEIRAQHNRIARPDLGQKSEISRDTFLISECTTDTFESQTGRKILSLGW